MPSYTVTLKDNAPATEIEKAEQKCRDQGASVTPLELIKGFIAEFPEDHVGTLEANEHIDVEKDKTFKTQSGI